MAINSLDLLSLNHYYGLQETLSSLEKGKNILVLVGTNRTSGKFHSMEFYLMKYEGFETEVESHDQHRYNRRVIISTFNWLFEDRDTYNISAEKEWEKHKLNIFGTHCMNFNYDREFELFLPSSSGSDLFLTIAVETRQGVATPQKPVNVITD